MTTTPNTRTGALFLMAFVVTAVGRDVTYEAFLSDAIDGLSFALLVCVAVATSSLLWLIGTGQLTDLRAHLTRRSVQGRVLLLGPMTGLVYGVTFSLIARDSMGAGLFNLVDGGLTPLLTALIGIVAWREQANRRFVLAFASYLIGIGALFSGYSWQGLSLLAIAVLSPIGTAGSYGLQKWLLEDAAGGLTYAQVLLVRFLPAAFTIWAYMSLISGEAPHLERPALSIPLALGLGTPPVVLLCSALSMNSLKRFSAWFFLIPAGAYLTTLPLRPDNLSVVRVLGAVLILSCIVVMERSERRPSEVQGS